MCRPSVLGACYIIHHVGCWELICDLYQSFAHQLWVRSTSAACGAPVEVSTGIVDSPSYVPPPCWRTHDAIAASLITLDEPFLPPCRLLLCPHTSCPHLARHAQTLFYLSFQLFIVCLHTFALSSRVLFMFSHQHL